MATRKLGVGIIGLTPGRSWAAVAHVPALQDLAEDYHIAGIANSSREGTAAAAAATGLRAFESAEALAASPDVDIVAVTVKVPYHAALVRIATVAGKHIFCEWPLGNGLAEARDLARLVRSKKLVGVVGTQACDTPALEYARDLIAEGYVGKVLSSSLIADSSAWGAEISAQGTYLFDARNGANLLTIPAGHALSALVMILGPLATISVTLATRRKTVCVTETGEDIPRTVADQVMIHAVAADEVPVSMHYRGGRSRATGLVCEITGTEGELQITAENGHLQIVPLTLKGARGTDIALAPLEIPARYGIRTGENSVSGNVRRLYERMAADIRTGSHSAPTFDDAVALHQVVAAIEKSAEGGQRLRPDAM